MDQAVAESEGQVVTYGDGLALTVYSASGGGFSATPEEGFGPGSGAGHPYLVAAPYPTEDPQPWTLPADLADLGRRFGYKGDVTAATVTRAGPSGRALEVTLAGSDGTLVVDGQRFASTLKLRSNLFTLRTEEPVTPAEAVATPGAGTTDPQAAPRAAAALEARAGAGGGPSLGDAGWIAMILLPLVAWVGIIRRADDGGGPMP
jgi:peptidoglycan hydrolase-like amidase